MGRINKLMKITVLFSMVMNLFGCTHNPFEPQILDGPGMEYVDSKYRTEYANQLNFDDVDRYAYWAVVYLGEGEIGKSNNEYYIEKLFGGLSEESIRKINHYDFGGDKMYLVIPRYEDLVEIIDKCEEDKVETLYVGEAFTINCPQNSDGSNVKIISYHNGINEISLCVDDQGKLICTDEIWDITEYNR